MAPSRSNKAYYPLWGSSPEADLSGNKFNGTVTGTTIVNNPAIGRYVPRRRSDVIYTPSTKFYLRNLTATNPPSAGEKSTVLPVDTLGANNATGTDETRALREAKGSAQTSLTKASDASTLARDNYLARFSTEALAAQTFGAGTWTIAIALEETNALANSFLNLSLYRWRPSDSSKAFIYDSHTNLGAEWGATEDGIFVTFTGSDVTLVNSDVLVLEVWRHAAQGMATAYNQIVYFEGATDVTDATTTDAASYLFAPAAILFFTAADLTAAGVDAYDSDPPTGYVI